ncbi:MAG: prepilin-type N-terminal cleavage/methylation domain-containing protein [Bacteroidota bacterium]
MKLNIRSYSGFTIVEILIALIISSILILIASQLISGFNKVLILSKTDWVYNNEILETITVFSLDLENCDIALKTDVDEITLTGENTVRYLFQKDTLIRCAHNIDSFPLSYTNLEIATINTDSIVTKICFNIQHKGTYYPVLLAKKYGTAEIYNYQILLNEHRYHHSYH